MMRRQKFQRFFAQRNDYRIFVGVPLAQPRGWDQVLALEIDALAAMDLSSYPIKDIRSWVVVYSGTGEIVDAENLFAPLPPGVNFIKSEKLPLPKFTEIDLQQGRALVRIEFSTSPTHAKDPAYYSTTLTNVSKHRIRCHAFGAYRKTADGFKLFTVTGTLFSANQFEEWYGVRRGGWIAPDETVCDPSNYGRDCVWVYHCETDQNLKFHAGCQCPALSVFGRLMKRLADSVACKGHFPVAHGQKWWPAGVVRPVQRIKSPLHHFNACRPKGCSRQDLHLHWRRSRRRASALGYASCLRSAINWNLPPELPRQGFFSKENYRFGNFSHGGRHANASQSPVLPRAWLAYDACLNAGSTAITTRFVLGLIWRSLPRERPGKNLICSHKEGRNNLHLPNFLTNYYEA